MGYPVSDIGAGGGRDEEERPGPRWLRGLGGEEQAEEISLGVEGDTIQRVLWAFFLLPSVQASDI